MAVSRVLVVDDNAENRALAAATLGDEGISVTLASSGQEALATFARSQPECVLLDIRMPGMDGIAVCEQLRALPGGERVAILFVTAQRDVATFDRALKAGGDDFITKPFRPSELLVRIQTAKRLREMTAERGALTLELKRQRDELQRLQLQKEQLTSFLVHDLKNPVHSIELHAQRVLRNATSDPKSRDAADKIREDSRGLLRMITNLLDITKSDEGELAPARRAVEVRELIEAAIGELRARAASTNLEVTAHIDATTAWLDRDLVHRVLANLIENAIRHAPERSTIAVSAEAVPGALRIRVADAGAGVPAELRERVFDRFVSTQLRTNHGLGLAFCRVAVEAHGGRIWIEDALPGAAFCFELPDVQ